jgi:hypothetical protein
MFKTRAHPRRKRDYDPRRKRDYDEVIIIKVFLAAEPCQHPILYNRTPYNT